MHGRPNEISVGVDREDLERFDDLHELKKLSPPYTIKEIHVDFNDKHLVGIEFVYVDHDNNKHKGHRAEKHKHAQHHKGVFNIDGDDELEEITVYQDVRINFLGFKTYKGKHHDFGHKVGEEKKIKYQGCTFGAVKGGFAEHIDYLVFQVHPLPEKNKDLEKHH